MAPKPALAKTASIRPKRSERGRGHRLDLVPLGHVAADRQRPLVRRRARRPAPRAASMRRAARTSRWLPAAARAVAAPMPLLAPVISITGSSVRSPRASRPILLTRPVLAIIRGPWIRSANGLSGSSSRSSVAVLLAVALVYTSFSASTEAKEPSELVDAAPGTGLRDDRPGGQGLGAARGRRPALPSSPIATAAARASRSPTAGSSPTRSAAAGRSSSPARSGGGTFVGEPDTLVTKCPSKFTTANAS